jgi:acetyl-CoA C-acetyltransferase
MTEAVIVSANRTAIGSFMGSLAHVPAVTLGATVIRAAVASAMLEPTAVDEVIMGHVLTAGLGQNTARQAAIAAGLPVEVPGLAINRVCGSGLNAVMLAAQAVQNNDARIVVAGGMESMSLAPHTLPGLRAGQRMGNRELVDTMLHDGLWDVFNNYHMGITAENLAERFQLRREQQDEFAAQSQARALAARLAGRFVDEITPVEVPQRKGPPVLFMQDEQPREDISFEQLSGLRPAFKKTGSVTAGNASSINDGAAAVVVMAADEAARRGLPAFARIKSFASAGVDPAVMGYGPVPATRRCLEKAGWDLSTISLIEANEAFAAQSLVVAQELGLNLDKVNVNGGAIALGHSIGASGCRVLVTLLYEMRRRQVNRGLATLCIGGGQGVAMALERT